jgi:hypothetical protein
MTAQNFVRPIDDALLGGGRQLDSYFIAGCSQGSRRVHVREGAMGIGFPGPDVQLVERAQAVTIRRAVEIKQLPPQRSGSF